MDKAISILEGQIARTMRLLGVSTVAELGLQHLSHLANLTESMHSGRTTVKTAAKSRAKPASSRK